MAAGRKRWPARLLPAAGLPLRPCPHLEEHRHRQQVVPPAACLPQRRIQLSQHLHATGRGWGRAGGGGAQRQRGAASGSRSRQAACSAVRQRSQEQGLQAQQAAHILRLALVLSKHALLRGTVWQERAPCGPQRRGEAEAAADDGAGAHGLARRGRRAVADAHHVRDLQIEPQGRACLASPGLLQACRARAAAAARQLKPTQAAPAPAPPAGSPGPCCWQPPPL